MVEPPEPTRMAEPTWLEPCPDALLEGVADAAAGLDSSEGSVKGALQRARATLDEHVPPGGLDHVPLPDSGRERELVGHFATAVERGDSSAIVSLLTDDAWLTMPPRALRVQGEEAIARFLDDRARRRGAHYRLVPTRANGQPAFGCYLPDPHAPIARAHGMMVLTLGEAQVSAITWFGERSLFLHFGLPRTLGR